MKLARHKRRTVLITAALAVLLADGAWFIHRSRAETPAFLLEPTQTAFADDRYALASLPIFDPTSRRWLFRGKAQPSLQSFVQDADPQRIGADSIGKFIVVRLPNHASAATLRQALLSLTAQGICKVAVVGMNQPPTSARFIDATVFRIRQVQGDDGSVHTCRERSD